MVTRQIAFLYGLRLIVHALAGVLAGPFFGLEWQVRSGQFDRYLVRPVSPLLQFMTQSVQVSVLGDLLGGLAIFLAATGLTDVAWTPVATGYLLLAVLGGALIELATRVLIGALTFKTLSSAPLMFLSDSLFSTYANYPLSIFGSVLAWVFTFLIPLAFVAYLPATVLLDRTAELHVTPPLAYAAPLVGVIWLAVAVRVFNSQLASYQSAGH